MRERRLLLATNVRVTVMNDHTVGSLMREVLRLHLQAQRASVACCNGMTLSQCFILTELGRGGPITLADLGRRLGLDKSWMSRAVDSMVRQGLLKKSPGQDDRRTILVSLSAGGKKRYAELNQILDSQAERVLSRISKNNQPSVNKALQLLREALRDEIASTQSTKSEKEGKSVGTSNLSAGCAS
jgi:DNA-binding MarR family transcriptional regulator